MHSTWRHACTWGAPVTDRDDDSPSSPLPAWFCTHSGAGDDITEEFAGVWELQAPPPLPPGAIMGINGQPYQGARGRCPCRLSLGSLLWGPHREWLSGLPAASPHVTPRKLGPQRSGPDNTLSVLRCLSLGRGGWQGKPACDPALCRHGRRELGVLEGRFSAAFTAPLTSPNPTAWVSSFVGDSRSL